MAAKPCLKAGETWASHILHIGCVAVGKPFSVSEFRVSWKTNTYCLCLLSVVMVNTMTKSHLGRKGPVLPYKLQSLVKGSQCRNLETRTEAGLWRSVASWLSPHGLFGLLSDTSQVYLSTTHSGLSTPKSAINQENAPTFAYRPIRWRTFLS